MKAVINIGRSFILPSKPSTVPDSIFAGVMSLVMGETIVIQPKTTTCPCHGSSTKLMVRTPASVTLYESFSEVDGGFEVEAGSLALYNGTFEALNKTEGIEYPDDQKVTLIEDALGVFATLEEYVQARTFTADILNAILVCQQTIRDHVPGTVSASGPTSELCHNMLSRIRSLVATIPAVIQEAKPQTELNQKFTFRTGADASNTETAIQA